LSVAVCNSRELRNELLQELSAESPGIRVVTLPDRTEDVLAHVQSVVPPEGGTAVFVLDLEGSLPSQAEHYPVLRRLNASREAWERWYRGPVVFWLSDYAADLLVRHAPDFWRYRSHRFEFVSDRATVGEALREPFPGFEMVDAIPFGQKRFRMAELEQRLQEAGETPNPDLLPHVLLWMYELAYLERHANHWSRAEELLRRAIALAESAFGPDAPETATALNNVAQLLHDTNRLAEAEPLLRRALVIDEASYGPDHPHVARDLNNLAALLKATNRLAEAERLMRRALAIDEAAYGPDHPHVATDLNNLAQWLQATNRLAEAEPLMRRAYSILARSCPFDHPNRQAAAENYRDLLRKLGLDDAAIEARLREVAS
jgi:tetratricopeptide (TPR) repeat protein